MVHFGPIDEAARHQYPEYDRLMIFDAPEEYGLVKKAAIARMARRQDAALEVIELDRVLSCYPEHMPSLVADKDAAVALSELLEEQAGDASEFRETERVRTAMHDLGKQILFEAEVYDGLQGADFDAFLRQITPGSSEAA